MTWRLIHADCVAAMRELDENSVDAIVTDPPYGLEFMGKEWDNLFRTYGPGSGRPEAPSIAERGDKWQPGSSYGARQKAPRCMRCGKLMGRGTGVCKCPDPVPNTRHAEGGYQMQFWHERWATEALRVLKPGGHLLAFGGTRTYHRLTCAIEDAGFEVRDCLAWLYGSGFPKSLDVSKAIDKAAGAEREVVGIKPSDRPNHHGVEPNGYGGGERVAALDTAPATPDAERWQGFGTAAKPAWEPVVVAVKPQAVSDLLATIGSHLERLSGWQAQGADPLTQTGAAVGSSDPTATSPSASTGTTDSSIVSSWRACWAELSEATSTFTTATTSSTTTDLRTLSSCLSQITPEDIIRDTAKPGSSSRVSAADHLFGAIVLSSRATRGLSALGLATANTPRSLPDGAEPEPRLEPIVLARKPLSERNVAANVLRWGTGALNVDECRVGIEDTADPATNPKPPLGRWPANVTMDETAAAVLDEQSGERIGSKPGTLYATPRYTGTAYNNGREGGEQKEFGYGDTGGASRFFYTAKAASAERNRGVAEYLPDREPTNVNDGRKTSIDNPYQRGDTQRRNVHPTVKPVDLMQWLVRLVTPPGGVVLDPFTGSGSTGIAALREGFDFIGIEREAEYIDIARARIQGDAPMFNVPSEVVA